MRSMGRTAQQAVVAGALLAGIMACPDVAVADGALAVGLPRDVAAEGFAYSFALDEPTAERASSGALRDCKKETPGVDKRAQALCAVVQTFKNRCFAVAMDPKDATPGVGWAVERDKQAAARTALAKCRDTAGDDRREACEVTHSGCDGDAR
jgi:Domain of unknown function (DUF4189)